MYSTKLYVIFFVLIASGLLESCGIFWFRKNEPIARGCFFDPTSGSIIYKDKYNDGIKRIEIELLSPGKNSTTAFFNKNYPDPVQRIDLSVMDTTTLMQNQLEIKIWDASPVIEDFNLEIKPSDWKQKKRVYCRYNTR